MDTWPQFAGEKEGRTYHLYPHLILNQTRVLDRFEVEDVTGGEVEESQALEVVEYCLAERRQGLNVVAI